MIQTGTLHAGAAVSAVRVRVPALAMAAVCWGALAFGAVYPWAYWPLAGVCLAGGTLALLAHREVGAGAVNRWLVAGLASVGAAIAVQLIPLPLAWLQAISPRATALLADTDFAFGAGLVRYHALSIDPAATAASLALYVSFAMLLVGLTRVLTMEQTRRLVEALTIFGVVLAVVGIVQKPMYAGKVYGFWEPETAGHPFGPFINKNHFAGWMLMAVPLTLSLLLGGLEESMRGLKPGWRYRILWLSSPEANRLILLATAAVVMAMSLVLTMSRSGIAAMALSVVFTGFMVARGLTGRSRQTAVAAYLLVLVVAAVSFVGADSVISRFSSSNWGEFNDRRGAWADAIGVASAFRVAGTGLNTYETAARSYQRHGLDSFYGESHNDYLELVAEGGLLVGLPILLCVGALAVQIRRRMKQDVPSMSWWLRRGAIAALFGIGLQETVEFSLQMPGNAALFAVVCAIALHRPREPRPQAHQPAPPERPRLRVVASNAFAGSR